MTYHARPTLDHRLDQPTTREMDEILDKRGEQRWVDETPEGREYAEKYSCRDASDLLLGWLTSNGDLPVTPRNLTVGFRELVADGILKPRPVDPEPAPQPAPKYSGPVMRPETTAERKVRTGDGETSLSDARKLSPIPRQKIGSHATLKDRNTAPVSQELVDAARESRLQRPGNQSVTSLPARWAEARAITALNHPEVALDSQRFNELVAQLVAESSQ